VCHARGRLRDESDTGVLGTCGADDLCGVVGAAVVDDQDLLDVGPLLRHPSEAFTDPGRLVVGGDHDGDPHATRD
jgi:hypothetical protein